MFSAATIRWSLEAAAGNGLDRKVGRGVVFAMSAEGATLLVPRLRRSFYFPLLSRPYGRAYFLPVLRTFKRFRFGASPKKKPRGGGGGAFPGRCFRGFSN